MKKLIKVIANILDGDCKKCTKCMNGSVNR